MKIFIRNILKALPGFAGASIMLLTLLVVPTTTGCSATTVANDIVNWTPTVQSAVAAVDAMGSVLLPADAVIFNVATAGFDAASNELVAQAKAYQANPTKTVLASLQQAVVVFEQTVNASLLAALKIVDPKSQAKVLADIGIIGTALNAIAALIMQIKGNTLAQFASSAGVKFSASTYTPASVQLVADHYSISTEQASVLINTTLVSERQAGM